ncbi:UDP-N-acetylglucosamine--N-acetylmuramyl-(pentapeptide) pyrophosphoryl-undecaprenol N-acetylglucosamine transferase [hydrothermal vent metagenome]|uniref:UDP-N-acetylglucosamine--N-acetylmuramyl-(Pentapeptide) pyrophosphoryl-undecaprenol N-acetylglucosamine transferase n=1 Tax=hydrothermal vent metagenome TaxID=652676 RepID=A0A3B1B9Z1_9ZZZZ
MGACVMIMAGGTGGHVFPALAVAEELRGRGMDVFWLGTRNSFEARTVPEYGIPMEWVDVQGLRGTGVSRWLAAPFKLGLAMFQSLVVLRRQRPAVVLGMGGFVAGPGGVMARLLGIPLVIHEQNAVPGMTNQWLARIANRVLEAFPGSFAPGCKAEETGNPVRTEITALPAPVERMAGNKGPLRLLIVGGSLGAQALNETVPEALAIIAQNRRPLVRHQAGLGKDEATLAAYKTNGVEANVQPFIADMAEAYGWADLVICRSGALTVSELAAAGVGSVLVPFPYAVDDHQTCNAAFLCSAEAARLMPQTELTGESLAACLSELLNDREQLQAMAGKARALAQPEAAKRVADVCLEEIA